MVNFTPCDLPRGKDGNAEEYFAKTTGFGYNDMISLPTLTKESIMENLSRRFKVRPAAALGSRALPGSRSASVAARWADPGEAGVRVLGAQRKRSSGLCSPGAQDARAWRRGQSTRLRRARRRSPATVWPGPHSRLGLRGMRAAVRA